MDIEIGLTEIERARSADALKRLLGETYARDSRRCTPSL